MLLLIDMDIVVYRAAFACEKKDKETEELIIQSVDQAYSNIRNIMDSIFMECNSTEHKGFLTAANDPTNFRLAILPSYKENRKKYKKPDHYYAVREYLFEHYNVEIVEGQEADDALAIEQYKNFQEPKSDGDTEYCNTCICTIDKDLDIVPGWHYNIVKDKIYFQNRIDGLRCFYKQILEGDRADNIPRISKGWKKKEAFKLLDDAKTEKEMLLIVKKEINTLYPWTLEEEQDYFYITNRGRLLWPRQYEDQMWETPK